MQRIATIARHADNTCLNACHVIDRDGTWHHVKAGDDVGAVFRTVRAGAGFSAVFVNPSENAKDALVILAEGGRWTVRPETADEADAGFLTLNEAVADVNGRIDRGEN